MNKEITKSFFQQQEHLEKLYLYILQLEQRIEELEK